MQKIRIDTVCHHIYDRNYDAIEDAKRRGCSIVHYPFKSFETDAYAGDFISSGTTITAKWRMLLASGIVIEKDTRTFIDVASLEQYARKARA